jgi:CHAT domain-containing protein/Flp pilus assembly protein TadD
MARMTFSVAQSNHMYRTAILVIVLLLLGAGWVTAASADAGSPPTLVDAWTLLARGQLLVNGGRLEEAVDVLGQALTLFRILEERGGESLALQRLGYCLQRLLDFEGAIRRYEEFLSLAAGPTQTAAIRAAVLGSLGVCYMNVGRYEAAIGRLEQAIPLLAIGDCLPRGETLYYLGVSLHHVGQYNGAVDALDEALANSLVCGDLQRAIDQLMELASCYSGLDHAQMAAEALEQALGLCSLLERSKLEDPWRHALVLMQLGILHREIGHYPTAVQFLKQSAAICQESGELGGEIMSLGNLALCMDALGERERAVLLIEDVLCKAEDLPQALQEIWRTHWGAGILYARLGELELAREHYETAIQELEALRGRIASESLRSSFVAKLSVRSVYAEYIRLLDSLGEGVLALFISECCHARTFLDLVAMGPVGTLENVVEEGIRSGVVEPSAIKANVDEVARSLPSNTAAIEYFVTDDATYVWVIYQGEIQGSIQLKHGRAELMHKVIDTRRQLGSSPEHPFNPRNLVELYDWLIRPVENLLPKTTGEGDVPHLIIIPSGPLYYLPFQAFIWTSEDLTENAPLIVRYALSYSPSLATLKYAQALADTAYPQATFLALADPDSGNPRLPDAQTEARMVAQLFTVSSVYVDSYATEDVVQSDSATAREILLSTHGLFNPHNPMFSYLVVSPTAENKDGKLYAYEVFSLPLHAGMVVLSACETLLPSLAQMTDQLNKIARRAGDDTPQELTEDQLKELTAGDEVVGLTRAFISAGASSVLSSLWSVPSGSTAALMVAFYGHLNDGLSKAEALRRAQMDVKAVYPHPWYWAAFNLMGDWR